MPTVNRAKHFTEGNTQRIRVTFKFTWDLVEFVKGLSGNHFHRDEGKFWTCHCTKDNIEALAFQGFLLDDTLTKMNETGAVSGPQKLKLDFSLCPLYNGSWNTNKTGKENLNHAERSIPKNAKSIESGEKELSKRKGTGCSGKSERDLEGNRRESRMAREGFSSNPKSNALPGNTGKTSEGASESTAEAWSELSWREWARTHKNSKISRKAIISMWVHKGVPDSDKSHKTHFQECSNCIQSRLRKPYAEDCNRTGRGLPPFNGTEKERCEENENINSPWMECDTFRSLHSSKMIPGLSKPLFYFQLEDIFHIEKMKGSCLLGLEMGLGKTIEALAWLHIHPEKRPVLIVCPSHLKLNWAQEIKMWGIKNANFSILSGMKPNAKQLKSPITIINYDILKAWQPILSAHPFQILIADECHYFRTTKALRTKAIKKIAKTIPHKILLSGTPAENKPSELYNAFQMISPNLFPSFWKYAHRYCGARHNGFGWDFSGATNTTELNQILTNNIMIRRKKEDVLKELPTKIHTFLPFEIDNRSEYDEVLYHFENEMEKDDIGNATMLQAIEALKQTAVRGKMKAALSWIENFLDSGEKLVIFVHHKIVVEELMNEFGQRAVKIDGSVSAENRDAAVKRFQEDPSIRLFVGNMQAAGTGITLTAASNVAFLELPWTPGVLSQCEDRCHRIGQKNTVNVYYLLATGTIEEKIATLLDSKRKVLDQILDGKETDQQSLLMELIKNYKKGEKK